MPFGSFRQRSLGKASNPQPGEANTNPPPRGRSITMPTVTPRKSWASLFDSYKRGKLAFEVSPVKSLPDALEEELYPPYDSRNPDHDPQRAISTPPQQKSLRTRRTPSPHPLKGTTASRLPLFHRRNRSQTSLKDAPSPKTFLESLADVIRAPTSLFYKDSKPSPKINDIAADAVTSSSNVAPQTPSKSPKKSVRFQPGASLIGPEPRSSPIDIPKPTPSLPLVQLAFTPLTHCFTSEWQGSIPTARPPMPQMLKSSSETNQNLTPTQSQDPFSNFETNPGPQGSLSDLPTPPGTNSAIEDPFADPSNDTRPGNTQKMLTEYDDHFQTKKLMTVTSADVVIDRTFASNDEKVQDLPQDLAETMSRSSTTDNHAAMITDMKPNDHRTNSFVLDRRESDTPGFRSSDSGLRSSTSSTKEDLARSEHFGERRYPASKSTSCSRASEAPLERYDADHELSDEPISHCQNHQPLKSAVGSQKWINSPTHEEIRQQFKAHHAQKGDQRKEKMENPAMKISTGGSTHHASCDASIAKLPVALSDFSRLGLEELDLVSNLSERENGNHSDYKGEVKRLLLSENLISGGNKIPRPTRTAELTIRSTMSPFTAEKKLSASESFVEPTYTSLDLLSSQNTVKEPGDLLLELKDTFIEQDSRDGSIVDHHAIPNSESALECKDNQTPSPTRIPLPASARPVREGAKNYVDQYTWSPFEEYRFPYAATAAIETDLRAFRRFLGLQGCFYAFWELCKLPDSTKPCRDTRGLTSSEIDTLFDGIKQSTQTIKPARSALLEAFKAILASDALEDYAIGKRPMSPESIQTIDATLWPVHSQESPHGNQLNNTLFRMKDGDLSVDSDAKPWLDRDRQISRTHESSSHTQDAALPGPGFITSISEEEKLEKASKVLQNFKPKLKSIQRRGTMESQLSLLGGRRRSIWSDKSLSGASTSATSTTGAMEEDEKFCQGIV